jgi:NAD(P)-dependent dehydrogenase (short-subunit alcohol dehydrogenase family)
MSLGEALCEQLACRGAVITVADIDGNAAEHVAACITQSGGHARAVQVDVSNQSDVARLVDDTVSEFGNLDYMINNAAIFIGGDARDVSVELGSGPQRKPARCCLRSDHRLPHDGEARAWTYHQRFVSRRAHSSARQCELLHRKARGCRLLARSPVRRI